MIEETMLGIAGIIVLGIAAQWLAWRLRLPSILLLLLFGFIAGPVTHFIDPDHLLGALLLPIVSLSVALILFEGGLSLKLRELREVGVTVRNLNIFGALITWMLSTLAASVILGFDLSLSILFGAILVVTGPTVIGPLLRHVRPTARVSTILKWEGIVIDPIGAMLAVLVFEGIRIGELQAATGALIFGIAKTVIVGVLLGLAGAGLLVLLLRRYWVPDYLQNAVTLMLLVGAFVVANHLQAEAGLLAVTVMGIGLANQRQVSIKHVIEFKENLRVLLLAVLFILLTARLQIADVLSIGLAGLLFVAVLIVIVRPVSVILSTIRSGLSWRERLFIGWMAPRGIVAAAVSSIFALQLAEMRHAQAELLIPATFIVIIGTVTIYGLTSAPVARWLKVAQPNPQGLLIVGAHAWARSIAQALGISGLRVRLIDTNWNNIAAARLAGLDALYDSILSEETHEEVDLGGIGYLLAMTSNDEVNSLACLQYAEVFGRAKIYQLPQRGKDLINDNLPLHLRGRWLFDRKATYSYLSEMIENGASLKATPLTREFDYAAYQVKYGAAALPLFVLTPMGELVIAVINEPLTPRPGQTLISLIEPAANPSS